MNIQSIEKDINDFCGIRKEIRFLYNPSVFTLTNGTDAVLDEIWSYQIVNKFKNHWYSATGPSDPQAGMIWMDSDDGLLYKRYGAAWVEIGAIPDKISEGDSYVEVVDAGTGEIDEQVDGGMVCKTFASEKVMQDDKVLALGTDKDFGLGYKSASDVIQLVDGVSLGSNIRLQLTADGEFTYPSQPAFLAYNSANDANVTGDGTTATVELDTEIFDQGGDFNTTTDTFTAPVTGRYRFQAHVKFYNLSASFTTALIYLVTSNRTYDANMINIGAVRDANNTAGIQISVLADLDVGDTARIDVYVYGGGQTVGVAGLNGSELTTWFSGSLEC